MRQYALHPSADLINSFIENGQPIDAIRLAHTFNLTHKYPPLTIMKDYIENAKKTAENILSKESYTLESLVSSIFLERMSCYANKKLNRLFIYFSTCSSVFFFYFEKFWIW
jgi:hypothetical protein